MKHFLIAVLLAYHALVNAQAPDKKQLIEELLRLQSPTIENLSKGVVAQRAARLLQAADITLQQRTPADKREAIRKNIDAALKAYLDETAPLLREHAIKLAPSTVGTTLDEKFSADELQQMVNWLQSPVNKKFQQLAQEMYRGFVQKLVAVGGPLLDPKYQVLQDKVRDAFGVAAAASAASAASGAAPAGASAPAK